MKTYSCRINSAEEKQALFAWSDPDGLIIDPADAV